MARLKDIKRKIGAVKQTQKITRAMNMVAAARLRQTQQRMENFRPYASKYEEVMQGLASRVEPDIHPFLIQNEAVSKIELVAFSSDRGLCGSFNANTINFVEKFAAEQRAREVAVTATLVGRKLRDYFRRRNLETRKAYTNLMSAFDYQAAAGIARDSMDVFLTGEVDEVWLCYTQFESMARQKVILSRLLPITPAEVDELAGGGLEYIFEPSIEGIMIDLLPKSIAIKVYSAMLETATSEHAARMSAMDNATKNCKEMIKDLTLAYNKARQAAVTAELLDIVGGAEALKQA